MTEVKIPPKTDYRIIQEGSGPFKPQYQKKYFFNLFQTWADFTYKWYEAGEYCPKTNKFNTLEEAEKFIDKKIEDNTITIYQ